MHDDDLAPPSPVKEKKDLTLEHGLEYEDGRNHRQNTLTE